MIQEIQKNAKGKVLAISTDVRDESSVINSINKVRDEFGKIDILVNSTFKSLVERMPEIKIESSKSGQSTKPKASSQKNLPH